MATVSRDKLKQRGLRRFAHSFRYALDGLIYAFKYEQNMNIILSNVQKYNIKLTKC